MKKLIFFVTLCLVCNETFAQSTTKYPINSQGEVEFSEVIQTSVPVQLQWSNAKQWIASSFGDYKDVIQFEDVENRKMVLKGIIHITPQSDKSLLNNTIKKNTYFREDIVTFIVTLECKDGRYRYRINGFQIVRNLHLRQRGTAIGTVEFDKEIQLPINYNEYAADSLQNMISILQSADVSAMRKSEATTHQNKIDELTRYQSLYYNLDVYTYDRIITLINSLKTAMNVIEEDF